MNRDEFIQRLDDTIQDDAITEEEAREELFWFDCESEE